MTNLKKLSRSEMRSVNGGKGSVCVLKITTSNGQSIAHPQYFAGTNEQASAGANAECVRSISNGSATKCGYDCAYDGFGN